MSGAKFCDLRTLMLFSSLTVVSSNGFAQGFVDQPNSQLAHPYQQPYSPSGQPPQPIPERGHFYPAQGYMPHQGQMAHHGPMLQQGYMPYEGHMAQQGYVRQGAEQQVYAQHNHAPHGYPAHGYAAQGYSQYEGNPGYGYAHGHGYAQQGHAQPAGGALYCDDMQQGIGQGMGQHPRHYPIPGPGTGTGCAPTPGYPYSCPPATQPECEKPTPRPADLSQPRNNPTPESSMRETGFYQAAPRTGTMEGPSAGLGLRGGAFTIPRMRVELPSIELPTCFRSSHAARMRVNESEAPWTSTGFERVISGGGQAQAASRGPGPEDTTARSAPDPDAATTKREYEQKIDELNKKIAECDELRKTIETSLNNQRYLPRPGMVQPGPYCAPAPHSGCPCPECRRAPHVGYPQATPPYNAQHPVRALPPSAEMSPLPGMIESASEVPMSTPVPANESPVPARSTIEILPSPKAINPVGVNSDPNSSVLPANYRGPTTPSPTFRPKRLPSF